MKASLPFTLYTYIAKEFSKWLGVILGGLLFIIFIFDLVETLRRTAAKANLHFSTALHLVFLKLPHIALQLFPFVILITTLVVFWQLMRARELIVMRMAGLSIWQILMPIFCLVFVIKVFELSVVNPLTASLYTRFERLESTEINGQEDRITLSTNGLWVRQADRYGQFILHAAGIDSTHLSSVSIFEFDEKDIFIRRFDTQSAFFKDNALELTPATVTTAAGDISTFENYTFPSDLTYDQIQENSANPATISFWKLPEFIKLLEHSNLSSHRYRLHWHSLIANVFLVISMVLLGSGCIYFQLGRKKVLSLIMSTLGIGFAIFFITDITRTLGLSMHIPILIAAWAPVMISALVGGTVTLYAEDT